MSDKLLSIVVPSYNMEKYLPKCLRSLLVRDAALLNLLDVIVVNDGSKDRTSEIAHRFESDHPGVFQVIDKENGNYGSCVNAAIRCVKGEYVRILDADDSFATDEFECFLRSLLRSVVNDECVDLFLSDYLRVNDAGAILEELELTGLSKNEPFCLKEVALANHVLLLPEITYRTSIFREIIYTQTEKMSYTDLEWTVFPMIKVRKVRYLPCFVYRYLIGRSGQTMEVAPYTRNFKMVEHITKRLVGWYCDRKDTLPEDVGGYLQRRIADIATTPYTMCLIGMCGTRAQIDLKTYDAYLKSQDQAIYDLIADASIKGRLIIRYVREWRRHCTDKTLRFLLFRFYSYLAMRRGALRHELIARAKIGKRWVWDVYAFLMNWPYEAGLKGSLSVMTRDETMRAIIDGHLSICRYGDDEFRTAIGRAMSTQVYNAEMHRRLAGILANPIPNCLCGIPSVFQSLKSYSRESRRFWRLNLLWIRRLAVPLINVDYKGRHPKLTLANSQISRCYTDLENKAAAPHVFELWKELFADRDILLVEGRYSRLGHGSDLLDGAKSIRRIWCPPLNAYGAYDRILSSVRQHASKSDLILLAVGGTATILAYDLSVEGYWAVDAGNVDLEYVWMRMGAKTKVAIPGRFIIECDDGHDETRYEDEERHFNVVAVIE